MTVLQLISSQGYYGAESMLVELAGALSRLGCEAIVGVFRDRRFPHTEVGEEARRRGLSVEIVGCDGRWDLGAVRRLRRLLTERRVDVIHAHGYKANLYALAAAWPNRTALLATCHNWPNRLLTMRAYAMLDRLVLRGFDRVATASPIVAGILSRWGVDVTPLSNGVDIERFRGATPTLGRELARGGRRLVGFVGRLVPRKGGALLLSAAEKVLAACPDTTFVVVGEGPSRDEWEALATRLGIARNVVFTGAREDMPGVYASLDILVLPSFEECMPMCLLEGMAAGAPVVATRVGAVPELIIPGWTGLLVEPGDVHALSGAILRLLCDPDQARRVGENGQAHVAQHFSAEGTARSYVALYEQALAKRGGRKQRLSAQHWQRSRI